MHMGTSKPRGARSAAQSSGGQASVSSDTSEAAGEKALTDWAARTIITVQEHLRRARGLISEVGLDSSQSRAAPKGRAAACHAVRLSSS